MGFLCLSLWLESEELLTHDRQEGNKVVKKILTTVKHGSYCPLKYSRLLRDVKSGPMPAPTHPTVAFGDYISLFPNGCELGNYQRAGTLPQRETRGQSLALSTEGVTVRSQRTCPPPTTLCGMDASATHSLGSPQWPRDGAGGRTILASRPHPQQGFRSCLGIIRLGKSYGDERLEAACQRALTLGLFL